MAFAKELALKHALPIVEADAKEPVKVGVKQDVTTLAKQDAPTHVTAIVKPVAGNQIC